MRCLFSQRTECTSTHFYAYHLSIHKLHLCPIYHIVNKQFRHHWKAISHPPRALQYYRNYSFKCFEVIALGSFRNTEIKFPTQSHAATEGHMRRNRKLIREDNEDISINIVVVAPGQWHCLYASVLLAIVLTFQVMTFFS